MKDGSIMVIGIAGGTGSGKTTITRKIMQHFGGNVSVIYHDNYYKAHHGMSYEERAKLNYDHPDAFEPTFSSRISRGCAAARLYIARPMTTPSTTARKRP